MAAGRYRLTAREARRYGQGVFGPQIHENLADALPVPPGGAVVDLGCGQGQTLAVLAARLDNTSRLVGVEMKERELPVGRAELIVSDLDERLPLPDGSFAAAVCRNVIECLRDHRAFLAEVERILMPGGHLLLAHSDCDTIVFSASDLDLTRRLVHRFCDTVQPWMTVADGTVGRRLVALARQSPLELAQTFAWVGSHTTFERCGPAHTAATLVAQDGRRDRDLAPHVDGWLADLERQADRGELFYSVNEYAVLLRKPCPSRPVSRVT
jgi:SAM-dependent methyltransferase